MRSSSAAPATRRSNEIVDDLAKTFNAPRERIMTDVSNMLAGLVDKRLIEV